MDLIELCKQNDRKAQHEVYKRYSKAMYNVCWRILNDEAEAEDALQESFIKAFKKLESFKGESTFGAWLKRITINTALNYLKAKKAEIVPLEHLSKEDHENNAYEPVGNIFEDDDDEASKIGRIKTAMENLPDGYRVVFSLYLIEGYDHAEIAGILGITESTSKSQYNRAKKKLKELLLEQNGENYF